MKKFLLSFFLMIAFAFYALLASRPGLFSDDDEGMAAAKPPTKPVPTTPAPVATGNAKFKDGTYIGPVTNAYFGDFQVSAVISGGRLTDIDFLKYPNDRGTSIRISNNSMPILKSEAIAAQSAKVDIVSGATQTSEAFQQSLAAALAMATK